MQYITMRRNFTEFQRNVNEAEVNFFIVFQSQRLSVTLVVDVDQICYGHDHNIFNVLICKYDIELEYFFYIPSSKSTAPPRSM